MKNPSSFAFICVVFLSAVSVFSEQPAGALSIGFAPALQVPIGPSAASYRIGGSSAMYAQYDLAQPSGFFVRGTVDYALSPYLSGNSLSLIAAAADFGYTFGFSPRFRLVGFAGGGYNYGFKNASPSAAGGSLYAEGGLGVDLVLTPTLGLTVGGSVRDYVGLAYSAGAYLGLTVFLSGGEGRAEQIKSTRPIDIELLKGFKVAPPGKGISIERVDFSPIFPVFRKYYDENPVGTIRIKNNERSPIADVTVSLFLKDLMDAPKSVPVQRLESGEGLEVSLPGLFNDRILEITESTKAAAEITVEYRMADGAYRAQKVETLRILDRNAMTWDDDRRIAAFVTAKDPAVLSFAKNVSGMLRDFNAAGLPGNLLAAAALHEALTIYGIAYVVDPKTPYTEKSKKTAEPDFLQFPRQTLQYRGGDCDDLSILNCALLQSVGVETAFITVPGHIYMAFSLGMSPDEARKTFSSTVDLIFRDDGTWVPVEITSIGGGFFKAWREGAKEWRENAAKKQAGFYPVRSAWGVYEAVGLPGSGGEILMPSSQKTLQAIRTEINRFSEAELKAQLERLDDAVKNNRNERDVRNRYGVLYARFGRYKPAADEFKKALARGEYVPALINLGNLAFISGEWKNAREFYERALKLDGGNPRVLLAIARAAFEQEDRKAAAVSFEKAKTLDPSVAEKFAYLGGRVNGANRASEAAARSTVLWEDAQ